MPQILLVILALNLPQFSFAGMKEEELGRLGQVLRQSLAHQSLQPVKNQGSGEALQRRTEGITEILRELRGVDLPNCPTQSQTEFNNWNNQTGIYLVRRGHSFDLSVQDLCSADNCQAQAAARIALSVPKSEGLTLRAVLDVVTSELRSPAKKDLPLGGVMPVVYRHYWAVEGDRVRKISSQEEVSPMDPEKTYIIKKCLNVKEDWSCNDLHYQIVKLSEDAFAVVTTEIRTDRFKGAGFLDTQRENFFDGFTAVTLVKDDGKDIKIYDSNHFNTETKEQTQGLKKAESHNVIDKMIAHDMNLLTQRLPGASFACTGLPQRGRVPNLRLGTR